MATQENWDERNQDQPIEFAGGNEVCEGCLVDLEQNGTRITALVKANAGDNWTAEVTAFPGTDADTIGDIKVGATIEFEDRHVFRCAA